MTHASAYAWHVVTCEFPPQVGGVSDYACTMATALAAEHPTHVWCPSDGAALPAAVPVVVHPKMGGFSSSDLGRVSQALDALPGSRRLFVQWVPHGYGYKSLNVGFAVWLARRAWQHGDQLHLMIHEPFVEFAWRPSQVVAALTHRLMLTIACASASKVWVSTPSWLPIVRPYLLGRTAQWLPIPAPHQPASALPTPVEAGQNLDRSEKPVVGHFSTHSPLVTTLLEPALDAVLSSSDAQVLLIGRGSDTFRDRYLLVHPERAGRVRATGVLEPEAVDRHVRMCDVMLQPYPDGVSARRTSTLGLMLSGVAIVTNAGHLTEPIWRDERAVELVATPDGQQLGAATLELLTNEAHRLELASNAAGMYDRIFDIRHSVAALNATASVAAFARAHA